jgi:hypothetical protein
MIIGYHDTGPGARSDSDRGPPDQLRPSAAGPLTRSPRPWQPFKAPVGPTHAEAQPFWIDRKVTVHGQDDLIMRDKPVQEAGERKVAVNSNIGSRDIRCNIRYWDIRYCSRYCTRFRCYHTSISEPPIFYPMLYLISELAYPDIGTPDIGSDIVPDIGDGMSDIAALNPDIRARCYRDQSGSKCLCSDIGIIPISGCLISGIEILMSAKTQ